jgi:hypothetical protein
MPSINGLAISGLFSKTTNVNLEVFYENSIYIILLQHSPTSGTWCSWLSTVQAVTI